MMSVERPSSSVSATVVIPNWNGLAHLPECLAALGAQTRTDFEIILVDNASCDDSVAWIERSRPDVQIIVRPENGGFAAAVNAGIQSARSDILVLLNNDTAVAPDWLEHLVGALDRYPAYDAVASKMVLYDDPARVNAAGDVYDPFQMVGRNRGLFRRVERYSRPKRVFSACAGAAAYRRSVFDSVGLFDERFFLNVEDIDLGFRMLLAGKRILYVPGAVVRHKVRATIGAQPSWTMDRLTIRNEMAVVAKDWPTPLLVFAPILWPYRTLRGVFPPNPRAWGKIGRNLRCFPDRLRAECEGIAMGLSERSIVQSKRVISVCSAARWMLIGTGSAGAAPDDREGPRVS
jgi:GT2 family glycosyltransferase